MAKQIVSKKSGLKRRLATRTSGFKVGESFSGKIQLKKSQSKFSLTLKKDQTYIINFKLPNEKSKWFCYGMVYCAENNISIKVDNPNYNKINNINNGPGVWSSVGSIWYADDKQNDIKVSVNSNEDSKIYFYNISCGIAMSEHWNIDNDVWKKRNNDPYLRKNDFDLQLKNLYSYSPQCNYIKNYGEYKCSHTLTKDDHKDIFLKNCNRCNEFYPVNLGNNERKTLSFSNHCGASKDKCTHSNFGIIDDYDTGKKIQLRYGFQLECRFCKKFCVNLPLNPQRNKNQMSEDSQRRRHFELLLTELYKSSPQLTYRKKTERELIDDIYLKFNKKCFACDVPLKKSEINVDHTRPLALLWQLDETATVLCKSCNSQKGSKYPKDFYDINKLKILSTITNIKLDKLLNPTPNLEALKLLLNNTNWFFNVFLNKDHLKKIKSGKSAAELICKSLDKVCKEAGENYSFADNYDK